MRLLWGYSNICNRKYLRVWTSQGEGEAKVLASIAMRRTLGEGEASILILILPQSSRRDPGHRKVIAIAETETETEAVIMGQGPGHCSIHPAALWPLHSPRSLALSAEAIYVSAYPTARQLQAMCGSRSPSRYRACSTAILTLFTLGCLRPTPKCPCWQRHDNRSSSGKNNNAACTYQVIKQAEAGFPLLIPLAMSTCHELRQLSSFSPALEEKKPFCKEQIFSIYMMNAVLKYFNAWHVFKGFQSFYISMFLT